MNQKVKKVKWHYGEMNTWIMIATGPTLTLLFILSSQGKILKKNYPCHDHDE